MQKMYRDQQARLSIARSAVFPASSFAILVEQANSFCNDISSLLVMIYRW
ncbi:MAG: hypothetical protein LBE95_02330 [Holosporaceae bacterium]|nr:hypothetical protein [Holosporaceae bacterium]